MEVSMVKVALWGVGEFPLSVHERETARAVKISEVRVSCQCSDAESDPGVVDWEWPTPIQ